MNDRHQTLLNMGALVTSSYKVLGGQHEN